MRNKLLHEQRANLLYRTFSTKPPIQYSQGQSFRTPLGTIKNKSIRSPHFFGVAQSRGSRPYQEDAYAVQSLQLHPDALVYPPTPHISPFTHDSVFPKRSLPPIRLSEVEPCDSVESYVEEGQSPQDSTHGPGQAAYFSVFDGHGSSSVSQFLSQNLHRLITSCCPEDVDRVVRQMRAVGGYFKRWRIGGGLERWLGHVPRTESKSTQREMTIAERCILAFLLADCEQIASPPDPPSGSVATTVVLHSLDATNPFLDIPSLPHYHLPIHLAPSIALTIAHLGDTSALLCNATTGQVERLTEKHHASSRVESIRLRKVGTGIVTDSFGESRWGGTLANTRGIGDVFGKRIGVTGEPDVHQKVLNNSECGFLVLVSDGVSETISDQEIIDLCRRPDSVEVSSWMPSKAAQRVVSFAEDVGAEDNMTVMVIALNGWNNIGGRDTTQERREYRLRMTPSRARRK